MMTKQILFLAFTYASFETSQPISSSSLKNTPLDNDCVGKAEGDECTALSGLFDVGGKCEGVLVIRNSG